MYLFKRAYTIIHHYHDTNNCILQQFDKWVCAPLEFAFTKQCSIIWTSYPYASMGQHADLIAFVQNLCIKIKLHIKGLPSALLLCRKLPLYISSTCILVYLYKNHVTYLWRIAFLETTQARGPQILPSSTNTVSALSLNIALQTTSINT